MFFQLPVPYKNNDQNLILYPYIAILLRDNTLGYWTLRRPIAWGKRKQTGHSYMPALDDQTHEGGGDNMAVYIGRANLRALEGGWYLLDCSNTRVKILLFSRKQACLQLLQTDDFVSGY
jgi:hypothetical protein